MTLLPCLVGPTGVGKTEIGYLLAKKLGAEIVSCDAFQAYRGLPVGTNQPSESYLREVPHHFIACRDPRDPWSAPQFAEEARSILTERWNRDVPVLVVGGSGFYLQALLEGAPPGDSPDPALREYVKAESEKRGPEGAHAWLAEKDPQAAARINPNDLKRVRRALEKSLSPPSIRRDASKAWGADRAVVWGLECSTERLDENLRLRCAAMWKGGLLEETRLLLSAGVPMEAPVWGAIGYREAVDHLAGKLCEVEALERIFRRTRQYAKRQGTWFRGHHLTRWIHLDSFPSVQAVVLYLAEQMRITA